MSQSDRDNLAARVEELRKRIERSHGDGARLRDALIGQRSDSTFWSEWERNKKALIDFLDIIDCEFPRPVEVSDV